MLRTLTIAFGLVALATSLARGESVVIEHGGDDPWPRRILSRGAAEGSPRLAAAWQLSEREALDRADAVLGEYGSLLFGPDRAARPALRHERSRRSLSGHQIFKRQTLGGIPVEGGDVIVSLDTRGRMLSIFNGAKPGLRIDDPRPALSPQAAIGNALAPFGESLLHQLDPTAELVVLPEGGGRLVYRVRAPMYRPYMDLRAYVDAKTGSVIRSEDIAIHEKPVREGYGVDLPPPTPPVATSAKGAATGSGYVFPANPLNEHPERYGLRDGDPSMDNFRESKPLERLDGSGFLRGAYADVENQDQPRTNEPSFVYEYSSLVNNGPFQEVNTYWHLDTFQHYIKTILGIDGAKDAPQLVTVHGTEEDNSSYFSGSQRIDLGDGGVDDSDDGEIVIHEYGHAIHDYISGIGYGNPENTALSEGFGDYLAATFGANPYVGEWDATSYSSETPPNLRRTDQPKTMADWVNEPHTDGEIISAAWWEIHEALGAATADQLILEAFFLFSPTGGFVEFADATILADRAINLGINGAAIRIAYENHGIIPTVSATLIVEHESLGDTENMGPYTVQASVSGAVPLRLNDPVQLFYRVLDAAGFTMVSMSERSDSLYEAEIPDPGSASAEIEYYIEAHPLTGETLRSPQSGVYSFSVTPPALLALDQNIPNPFNPQTSIAFVLPASGRTTLRVYDVAGRLVRQLLDGPMPAGVATPVIWKGDDDAGRPVASGVYFYELKQGSRREMKKMVLLR